MGTGRPLIPLQKESMIFLYTTGISSYELGEFFGVSWATIIRRLRAWGIPLRQPYQKGVCPCTKEQILRGTANSSKMQGKKHSDEARTKMAISQKGKNKWSKGRTLSIETRQKISLAVKLRWQNPEYRAKVIQALKARWADPDYADRVRPLIIKGNFQKPTQPEQRLIDIIKRFHLPFKYTGDGKLTIHGFNPDFVNCNGAKVIIEVFGDYWHGKRARTWKETELGRIMIFNSFGFKCIVLWEKELNTLPDELIVGRIRNETRRLSNLHGNRVKG